MALLSIALCAKALTDQWASVRHAISHAKIGWIAVGLVCSVGGMAFLGALWWRCLRVFGHQHRRRDAAAWYFGGELGKYLPGGIWPVLGRGELARRGGISRGSTYAMTLVSYAVMCIAASIVCGVLAPFTTLDHKGPGWSWALVLLVPAGIIAVHPVVLRRVLAVGEQITRGRLALPTPPWSAMLSLVAWAIPTWLLIGAASSAITEALGYDQQPARVAFAAVAAWILGFLAVPVPAGAGVRELIFIGTSGLAAAPAAAVATVARLLLIVVDIVGGVCGLWLARQSGSVPVPGP